MRSIYCSVVDSVADPDPFDTDPDPALHFNTDPDPCFHFATDPDTVMCLKQYFFSSLSNFPCQWIQKDTTRGHTLLNFPFQLNF
jgi:hypothetical protein